MANESNGNRWWEGYLVRYLMPSIAGMVIVNVLTKQSDGLRDLLFIPNGLNDLDGPRLILMFLYGNLFCYIASYPVLTFHATRVLDFDKEGIKWPKLCYLYDGYISSISIAVLIGTLVYIASGDIAIWIAYGLACAFSGIQIHRIIRAFNDIVDCRGLKNQVTSMYGLVYALARRRGVISESKQKDPNKRQDVQWQRELVESYRHLREHGNTAFIFFLELILAGLCFLIVSNSKSSNHIYLISLLFGIWTVPSVLIHLIGQHLERRFSLYDRRVNAKSDEEMLQDEAEGSL